MERCTLAVQTQAQLEYEKHSGRIISCRLTVQGSPLLSYHSYTPDISLCNQIFINILVSTMAAFGNANEDLIAEHSDWNKSDSLTAVTMYNG